MSVALIGVPENTCSLLVFGVQRKSQICRHSAGPLLKVAMTFTKMVSIFTNHLKKPYPSR